MLRDAFQIALPAYRDVRLDSADLTDIQPAEYRADLVFVLLDAGPVYGIIVEVQLTRDDRKHFTWPAYVMNLRARLECPVCLLVVCADDAVARWAARTVEIGGGNFFSVVALGPSGVPKVTDPAQARADPEFAVLSAMTHGRDADTRTSARIALAALAGAATLEEDRSKLYFDLIMHSLDAAARRRLMAINEETYEYQSAFARRYIRRGRVTLVLRQLEERFGAVAPDVRRKILRAEVADLDAIGVRLLTASTLQEALGSD
jgi:Domain of unknown function (DUF4351)